MFIFTDFSKRFFFNKFLRNDYKIQDAIKKIENYAQINGADVIENRAKNFVCSAKKRWEKASRKQERFNEWNKNWLDTNLYTKNIKINSGRPPNDFMNLSESQKRR